MQLGDRDGDSAAGAGVRDERDDRYGVFGGGADGGGAAGEVDRSCEGLSDGNVVGVCGRRAAASAIGVAAV